MKGLSKSFYTSFCQCPEMIWLKTDCSELIAKDASRRNKFANFCNLEYQIMSIKAWQDFKSRLI